MTVPRKTDIINTSRGEINMTEDTKLILDKLNAMEERLNAINGRFDTIDEKLNVMYKEMTDEFKAIRCEVQNAHDELGSKIDDLQKVTGLNCYELTLLKAKA